MRELDKDEQEVIKKTVELWELINNLPTVHKDDIDEHRRDIHDIQNRILSRPYTEAIKQIIT